MSLRTKQGEDGAPDGENAPVQPPPTKWRRRLDRFIAKVSWTYLVFVIALWLVLRFAGDRWWATTPLLFGPRWIWALPLILLVPAALFLKRRLLYVDLAAALVVMFPIMGVCVPTPSLGSGNGAPIRVLTCNLDGRDPAAFWTLVEQTRPDIIACQEYRFDTRESDELTKRGWHVQSRHGGLFLASRFPITSETYIPTVEKWRTLAAFFVVQTPAGPVHVVNVHFETSRKGLEALLQGRRSEIQPIRENIARRRMESEQISEMVAGLQGPVIIAGDFNLPTDSAIFRDCWSNYDDAFEKAGWGLGNTKFTRRWGVRIDHILVNENWRVRKCYVGPDVGSSHRPVIAEIQKR